MKKLFLVVSILSLFSVSLFSQNKEEAEQLVAEGISYHDRGDYETAISKYDKALKLDKDNLFALAEKSMSLFAMGNYSKCIKNCKLVIEKHPGNPSLKTVYITYGNALDADKQSEKSLEVYDEGIALFPDENSLYYNKGITLSGMNRTDEALTCFEKSLTLNPEHLGSHNAIARITKFMNKKISSILAYCRFLVLESETPRAAENLESLRKILKGNAKKTGNNSMTINISSDLVNDTTAKGQKPKPNNFSSTELILTLTSGLDLDIPGTNKTDVERFIGTMNTLFGSLGETKKDNNGFYWEFYAPYFIEMKEKNMVETFGYIVFASTNNSKVNKWIETHQMEVEKFQTWSKAYSWN